MPKKQQSFDQARWDASRFKYMKISSWLIASLLVLAVLVRPLLTDAPRSAPLWTLSCALCFFLLPLFFRVERLMLFGTCVVALAGLELLVVSWLSNGLTMPVIYILPVLPLLAAFFTDARRAIWFTLIVILGIFAMGLCHVMGWGIPTPLELGDPHLLMRGFAVIIALVIVGFLIVLYDRHRLYQVGQLSSQQDQLLTTLSVIQDRTNALEEARAKAEAANEAKSTFLASVSHELRTPLNAIINLSRLAIEGQGPPSRRSLETIFSSSKGLLRLLNDVLDLSKIEADKMIIESAPFRLDQSLEEVVSIFQNKLVESPVELLLHLPSNVPRALVGDALRLRQVLLNLFSNAFKFTERGEISLRVECLGAVDPVAGPDQVQLRFVVRDTGIGMAQETQTRLFEAFEQLDGSITRKYGGSGLGLAICQRLLGLMDSSLTCESALGVGSEFAFVLAFESAAEAPEPPVLPEGLRSRTVLVIDESASHRALLQSMFRDLQLTSLAFPSVEAFVEATDMADLQEYSLVLLGWSLTRPGASLRQLQGLPMWEDIPILVMAPTADGSEEKLALFLGANGFLRKPILPSVLVEGLKAVLTKAPVTHPTVETSRGMYEQAFSGYTALVAEDNQANQLVVQSILRPTGLRLSFVDNGRDAVKRAMKGAFSLILMDLQMPELDGLEATRQLRGLEYGAPIIAMTANAMVGDAADCFEAGMNDYVPKPIDPVQFLQAIARWLPEVSFSMPSLVALSPSREMSLTPDRSLEHTAHRNAITSLPLTLPAGLLDVVDLQEAMGRLDAPWPELLDMLKHLARQIEEVLPALAQHMDDNNLKQVQFVSHSLAGIAGNLCVKALYPAAKMLSDTAKRCHDCQVLAPLTADLVRASTDFLRVMGPLLDPVEAPAKPRAFNPEELLDALSALIVAIPLHDIVLTLSCAKKVQEVAVGRHRPEVEQLMRSVDEFELEDALQQAVQLTYELQAKDAFSTG